MISKGRCIFVRRGLLIAGILAATCSILWAQNGSQPDAAPAGQWGHRGGNPERQLRQLTKRLQLTPDQQTQVKSLLVERRQKMEELRRSSAGSDASAQAPPSRQQMEAIRNDTDTKISALLNDDQKSKFAALQQERKARMERRQGPGGDNPPPPPGN
jgi:protein CpxP